MPDLFVGVIIELETTDCDLLTSSSLRCGICHFNDVIFRAWIFSLPTLATPRNSWKGSIAWLSQPLNRLTLYFPESLERRSWWTIYKNTRDPSWNPRSTQLDQRRGPWHACDEGSGWGAFSLLSYRRGSCLAHFGGFSSGAYGISYGKQFDRQTREVPTACCAIFKRFKEYQF